MTIPAGQAETAAFLHDLTGAAPRETHISAVFVAADRVLKLRKAVSLGFLDFSTLAERERTARREFELNAPHAPGLYRGVAAVVRRPDGTLALGGDGTIVDWVVEMAPVPAADFLDVIAERGDLDDALLDATADAVAAYHDALPPVARDQAAALRAVLDGNARAARDAGLPHDAVARWEEGVRAALHAREDWLAARGREHFVRRAHGDLHLGNLCLWQGRPVPFDALEFDEDLATIDVAYDLAFLLMDVEHRAGRAAANRLLNRYVARTGDCGLVAGLPPFLALRAMVRAHVEARRGHPEPAAAYLDRALSALAPASGPVAVVAIGGLPGTGKSTLARALAPDLGRAPGALILRSDEIRKRLHHAAPEQRLPAAAYSEPESRRVLETLAADVAKAASAGQAVIADATFMNPADRRAVAAAAAETAGARFTGLWLTAPLDLLVARVRARTGDASDATVDVLRRAASACPGAGDWIEIDTTDRCVSLAASKDAIK